MVANNLGHQGPNATPETVQQHILDAAGKSSSENGKKSRKGRIPESVSTVHYLTFFYLMKVSFSYSVGSQDVRHGASGVQQLPLRKYGGMRN